MHDSDELSNFSLTSCNSKVKKLDKSLQQSLIDFKDLQTEFEKVCIDSENYKCQFLTQKEKCESQICSSGEILNKVIEAKNKIIQLIASSLTQLSETKNFAIIEDIFKVLCEESYTVALPKQSLEKTIKKEKTSPRINESVTDDISFNCSGNEIEGTPGRTSPILKCKKVKTKDCDNSSDFRDKKKCPATWPTPDKKAMKLQYPIPMRSKGGKMRQMRLNYGRIKTSTVVDLTCSTEFSGGLRCSRTESSSNLERLLIKKESSENDDTIMPSPTSGSSTFPLLKSKTKDSPVKYKKPLSLNIKKEKENQRKLDLLPIKRELKDKTCLEDSVNISNPVPERSLNDLKKGSPFKQIIDQDRTHCDNSISILPQCSPSKRPLVENINKENVPNEDIELSISLLRPEAVLKMSENDDVKRKMPEPIEPVFKEAAVRKKSEKRALPGWICEECKNFYGVLYEDNPLMLAKMIEECSKHRGRQNPARPKTPPNFWNPRWEVPEDTEELNRLNNAI